MGLGGGEGGIGQPDPEGEAQTTYRFDGKLLNAQIQISGTADSILRNRINSINGNFEFNLDFGGVLFDLLNEEKFINGDIMNWRTTRVSGAGVGTLITYGTLCVSNQNTNNLYVKGINVGYAVPSFFQPTGSTSNDFEDQSEFLTYYPIELKDMHISIRAAAGAHGSSNFVSRVAGSDGNLALFIPTNGTGHYEDSINRDNIPADTKYCYSGRDNQVPINQCSIRIITDNHKTPMDWSAAGTHLQGNTNFNRTFQSVYQQTASLAGTYAHSDPPLNIELLHCYIGDNLCTTNTDYDSFINQTTQGNMSINVSGGASGDFLDELNSDDVAYGDSFSQRIVTGDSLSGPAFELDAHGCWAEHNAATVSGGNQAHIIG